MIRTLLLASVLVAGAALPDRAQAAGCGWYAFAGAFQSYRSAQNRARNVGGRVFDVDASNSPNAGRGFFAVGFGPTSRRAANDARRNFRRNGVPGAYVANRCFY